jgi:arylsulfatase A-like enzyme
MPMQTIKHNQRRRSLTALVIVVMTDDQETSSLLHMPKLHRLIAEQGITFDNSFVNLPLCAPSRASFLTGQAAHNHGIKANSPLDGGGWDAFKQKEAKALPVWLQTAGYETALIGKYINRYRQESTVGAWLSWAGRYLNIDFSGPNAGTPREWGAAGLGSLVCIHRLFTRSITITQSMRTAGYGASAVSPLD